MKKLILASNSPRRKELLGGLGVDFEIDTLNNFEESDEPGTEAHQVPVDMCLGKSAGFHRALEQDELLITADTVVIVDGAVLGKPHSRQEAFQMLSLLAGRTHEVVTAVCLRTSGSQSCFTDSSLVTFAALSAEEINYYLDNYRPYDKAGSYGVQEWIGYVAISRIEGSFYNVMGLPVHKLYLALKEAGCIAL